MVVRFHPSLQQPREWASDETEQTSKYTSGFSPLTYKQGAFFSQNLKHMNRPQEQYDRLNARLPWAGGFETALIEAWMKADGTNKTRLENAFEDLLKGKQQ